MDEKILAVQRMQDFIEENPILKQIYKEFLGEPGSHKAHELLHTTYSAKKKYNI